MCQIVRLTVDERINTLQRDNVQKEKLFSFHEFNMSEFVAPLKINTSDFVHKSHDDSAGAQFLQHLCSRPRTQDGNPCEII